jgi:hypothetical protein
MSYGDHNDVVAPDTIHDLVREAGHQESFRVGSLYSWDGTAHFRLKCEQGQSAMHGGEKVVSQARPPFLVPSNRLSKLGLCLAA